MDAWEKEVNINGTRNVMEAAIATRVSKVVHVSTTAVCGNAELPVTEDSEMGNKCATELGITYTPIHNAIKEAVESFKE